MQRVVVVSDLHCGHRTGLTHPIYNAGTENFKDTFEMRRKLWDWYKKEITGLKPIDYLISNGDVIEGKGTRNTGIELLSSDRNVQTDMAVAALKIADAKEYHFTYGTGYHTGPEDDWEVQVAARFDTVPVNSLPLQIGKTKFDIRHYLGSSSSPVGRFTALSREQVWTAIWAMTQEEFKADILIRSHVHYFGSCQNNMGLMISTPALQGPGTNYGARQMSGVVDFGFIHFDIEKNGDFTWKCHLLKLAPKKSAVVKR